MTSARNIGRPGTVKLLRRSTKPAYCEADERPAYAAVWPIVVSGQVENAGSRNR